MINDMEKSDYLKILCLMLMTLSSSNLAAKNSLDDNSLAEQYVGLAKLSPIIINAVKQDAQQPVDEQNKMHGEVAKEQADKAKKDEIYTTVLTDFEWQKKDPDANKPSDKYLKPYDKFRLIEVGYNPYQRHDVRVTTADRITIYVGHEIDGVGFK